jgi:predicted cobalt transporter CbtA
MKNPIQSKTYWGLAIIAAASLLERFGVSVDVPATNSFVDQITQLYTEIMQVVGFALAIYGRWKAEKPISFTKG